MLVLSKKVLVFFFIAALVFAVADDSDNDSNGDSDSSSGSGSSSDSDSSSGSSSSSSSSEEDDDNKFRGHYKHCKKHYPKLWKRRHGESTPRIIGYLNNITYDSYVSITINVTLSAEYQTWLTSFASAFNGYVSEGLSSEEILIRVSEQLLVLKYQYSAVYEVIKSVQLGSYGSIEELVSIAAEEQTNNVLGEIQENGEEFLDKLVASVPSSYQSSFQEFVTAHLQSIVESDSLSVSEKLSQIYYQLATVYLASVSSESDILLSEISGFGYLASFYNIAQRYYQVELSDIYVGGSSPQFLIDFNATILASSLPKTQKAQLNTILKNLTISFETITDVEERLSLFASIYQTFLTLTPSFASYSQKNISKCK